MTSPTKLPGNGFSVWTNRTLPLVALTLSEPAVRSHLTLASAPEPVVAETAANVSNFESERPIHPTAKKGGGSLMRWVAALLIGSSLAAFLSSESKRKDLIGEVNTLVTTNDALVDEKTAYHDNWKQEEQKSAALGETITGLEKNLSDSKANVVQLTAQKEGLSQTITELRNALAMTVEEMKNTEASLNKVIASLESTNKDITAKLNEETSKLEKLGTELAGVKSQLEAQKASNEKLAAENKGLSDKVAQLQSSLDKTIQDAEQRETAMREQIGALTKTNEELAASLEAQQKELGEVKAKLQASEDENDASEKEDETSQSKLKELSRQLDDAVASRDALQSEKQALSQSVNQLSVQLEEHQKAAPSTEALQEEINTLKASSNDASTQIKGLEKHRDTLLLRNENLQSSVQQLNTKLSSLAEQEGAVTSKLTERINVLMADNEQLKKSLETQRIEFKALLKKSNDSQEVRRDDVSAALQDVKETLSQSLRHGQQTGDRLRSKNEQFSNTLVAHTNEILDLNTRIAQADDKIAASQSVLDELESLRQQVTILRAQGTTLEDELSQRVIHISTLNASKNSWKEESLKLRSLLESESAAQAKLASFVAALQERIGDLETSYSPEVAAK